jgi:hypothetical protein
MSKTRLIFSAALVSLFAASFSAFDNFSARASASPARAQEFAGAKSSADMARKLSSRNPLQRREAAEEIARDAAVEHLKLVEGYRVQEKDARVRLALDWALYRLGRTQALFPVVDALDTSRADQAVHYLSGIEGPAPLHVFLARANDKTRIRLLEVLARVGDAETLEQIKPFYASLDPTTADAAKFAEREITIRLEEAPKDDPKRPRQTGKKTDEDDTP